MTKHDEVPGPRRHDDIPLETGRCKQCRNWLTICGHDLPFKDRIKTVRADTGWMPNTGSTVQRPFGGE